MKAIRVESLDPTYNLALEEVLYDSLQPKDEGWFLIWRNEPSIIIGRHQNTLEEINEAFVRKRALHVVRRPTGGGAVYHDEGNVNFSFLTTIGNKQLGFIEFLSPIVVALGDLGLQAEFSSRNDITVNGRKISGSAQRRSGYRMLHHGTMMVDLDMSVLGQALTGNPDKYESKGVASHKSRVANLLEFLPQYGENCMEAVILAILKRCADEIVSLPMEVHTAAVALADAKYRTWDWNYGKSPEFTESRRRRFSWGALECKINVKEGKIVDWRMYGDFFSRAEICELEVKLTGIAYQPEAIEASLTDIPIEQWFAGSERRELMDFLSGRNVDQVGL